MALLNICGFEWNEGREATSCIGTYSVQSAIKRSGQYALRCNPTTDGTGYCYFQKFYAGSAAVANMDTATLYASFDFRCDTRPSADDEPVSRVQDSVATLKAEVRINSAGHLVFYDKDLSVLATGTATLATDGTWYRIDIKYGTGTDAAYEVRVNGASDISGTSSNTGANNTARFYLGKSTDRNGESVDYYFDNVILSNSAYANTATVVEILSPDSDGTNVAWTASTGDDWDCVNELANSDSTYLYSTGTSGDESDVNLESTASAGVSGTIAGVLFRALAKRHGANNGSYLLRIRSGASTSDSAAATTTSTESWNGLLLETDPATSAAWTTSGLDAVQLGVVEQKNDGAGYETRWYNGHLMVAFIPASGGKPNYYFSQL